jgi:hypothetical protein
MYVPNGSPEFVRISQALDLAIKADLQSLRDWYFDCLLVCTAIVGLGVFMEGFEICHDMWGIFRRKSVELYYWTSLSIDRKPYHAPNWMKVMAAVGWVFIVLGVAGEGVYEGFVSKYDSALSSLNDTLIAETQKETAVALARAVHAETTAKQFDVQIAESNSKAKSAEAIAKGFEAQIADAKARTAQAELELAQIKQWRTLKPKQQEEIGAVLSGFAGQDFAFLAFGDPESMAFLRDINATLKIAKWNRVSAPPGLGGDTAYNVDGIMVPTVNDTGLDVYVGSDNTAAHPAALALAAAISKAGIHCEAHLSDWLKDHGAKMVVIRVGKKLL